MYFASTQKTVYAVVALVCSLIIVLAISSFAYALEEAQDDIYCPQISRNIKKGFRDANSNGSVSELQQFLSDYYDVEPGQIITGYFGNVTRGYVVRFQTEQNFPADSRSGIVGTLTRTRIASSCTSSDVTPSRPTADTAPTALTCPKIPVPTCVGTLTPTTVSGCTFYTCTPSTTVSSCVPLPAETRTQSCAVGQTGSISEIRTSSCPVGATAPVWGAWIQVTNSCSTITCTPLPSETRTATCPAGQVGAITEMRTSSCVVGATAPTWTGWSQVASTCSVPVTYSWEVGIWGSCTSGSQSRAVTCKGSNGATYPDTSCTEVKPATTQSCSNVNLTTKSGVDAYLRSTYNAVITAPGNVVILPPQETGSTKGLVILPDGSPLDVSSSQTAGIQEAYDYALQYGWDLFIYGRGKYDIKNTGGRYQLSAPLVIPATQGKTVRIYDADLVFGLNVSTFGVKLDSVMMLDWYQTGSIEAPNAMYGVYFAPENGHPLDGNIYGTIGNVASRFSVTSVSAKNTGVRVNTTTSGGKSASTNGCEFSFGSILGNGSSQSIQVANTYWSANIVRSTQLADLAPKFHDIFAPNNALSVFAPTGTSRAAKIIKPDGSELVVSSSNTSNIQEAVNYAAQNGLDLYVYGRGLDLTTIVRDTAGKPISWGSEGVFAPTQVIQFPVMNNSRVKIYNVTIYDAKRSVPFTQDGLFRMNGGSGFDFELTGQAFSRNMAYTFKFEPSSAPLTASQFRIGSIASAQFSEYFQKIDGNKFYFNEVIGSDNGGSLGGDLGISVTTPNGASPATSCFCNNFLSASFVHGQPTLSMQIGQQATNANRVFNNSVILHASPDDRNPPVGLQVWGVNNRVIAEIYGGGRGVSFEPSASGNIVNTPINNGAIRFFHAVAGANTGTTITPVTFGSFTPTP